MMQNDSIEIATDKDSKVVGIFLENGIEKIRIKGDSEIEVLSRLMELIPPAENIESSILPINFRNTPLGE